MPRKKSNAKKAREAAKKLELEKSVQEEKPVEQEQVDDGLSHSENESAANGSSSSEDEDDFGELITEEVEDGINRVLSAIKNNEKDKLLDPNVRFFEEPEKAVEKLVKDEKHKPIYLKDYHRMNILSGNTFEDDEPTVDGEQSYASQQRAERSQLIDEIKNAFDEEENDKEGSEEEDDDFLRKKEPSSKAATAKLRLPDPNQDEEKFLEEFVNNQAWIPRKGDKVIPLDNDPNMEEDDDEFDDAAEKFENAYNFRYEDPNAATIVSYARNQATLRRSETSSRRRKREQEKQTKEVEKEEKEKKIQKKKKEKVHKLTDVLEQLKKEYGADIDQEMVQRISDTLLNSDFKENEWDTVVSELFNEEFYGQKGKPTWDEDDEVMAEYYQEKREAEAGDDQDQEDLGQELEHEEAGEKSSKKSRKDKVKDKKLQKKGKKELEEMVDDAVEQNKLSIIDEVENDIEERKSRARTKDEQDLKFKYREVSPESFGLSTREIFAADDTQLNQFIGLKKFAPYRPKEQRMKDKRKVTKSKRLREWRKEVFRSEKGLEANNDYIELPVESEKKRKDSHKKRKKHKTSA